MDSKTKYIALALSVTAAAGAYLRVAGLGEYYYNPDEALVISYGVSQTLLDTWRASLVDPHPPMQFLVLRLLREFGDAPLLMRAMSLAPGVASIVALYFLGKEAQGRAAGLVMANIGAFAPGAVVLSQALRPYSMNAFFTALALVFFFRLLRQGPGRGRGNALGYSLFMALSMLTHYSAVMYVSACGLVWAAAVLFRKSGTRAYAELALAQAPLAAIGLFLYFTHVTKMSFFHEVLVHGWLADFFPDSPAGFLAALLGYHQWLFTRPLASWTLALAGLGLAALALGKRKEALAAGLLVAAAAMGLAWREIYPMGHTRHSFSLFPVTALFMAAPFQLAYGTALARLRRKEDTWPPARTLLVPGARGAALAALSLAAALAVVAAGGGPDYFRKRTAYGRYEFPVKRSDYERLAGFMMDNWGPGDAVFTSDQTAPYLMLLGRDPTKKPLLVRGVKIEHFNHPVFVLPGWELERRDAIEHVFPRLDKLVDVYEGGTVWFLNVGWGDIGNLERLGLDIFQDPERRYSNPAGYVVAVPYKPLVDGD